MTGKTQEELKIWPPVVKVGDQTIDVKWTDHTGLKVVAGVRDDRGRDFALAWDDYRHRFSTHRQRNGHEGYPHRFLEFGSYLNGWDYREALAELLRRARMDADHPAIIDQLIEDLQRGNR